MVGPVQRGSYIPPQFSAMNRRLRSYISMPHMRDRIVSMVPDSPWFETAISYLKRGVNAFTKAFVFLHDAVFLHFQQDLPTKKWSKLAQGLIKTCKEESVNTRKFVDDDLILFAKLNPEFFKQLSTQFFVELKKAGNDCQELEDIGANEFVQNYLVYHPHNFSVFLRVVKSYS